MIVLQSRGPHSTALLATVNLYTTYMVSSYAHRGPCTSHVAQGRQSAQEHVCLLQFTCQVIPTCCCAHGDQHCRQGTNEWHPKLSGQHVHAPAQRRAREKQREDKTASEP